MGGWGLIICGALGQLLSYTLLRFGFLAVAAMWVFIGLTDFPLTLNTCDWYAGFSYAIIAVTTLLAFGAFRISLGRQRLLSEERKCASAAGVRAHVGKPRFF
jgi:hypothetical protein